MPKKIQRLFEFKAWLLSDDLVCGTKKMKHYKFVSHRGDYSCIRTALSAYFRNCPPAEACYEVDVVIKVRRRKPASIY